MNNEQFFDSMAHEWDSKIWSDPPAELFRKVIGGFDLPEGGAVLDIACGTGVLFPYYLERIGAEGQLYAFDVSGLMLKEARKKFPENNVMLLKADAHGIPLRDNSCDAVVAFSCFPHFEKQKEVLREMKRVARPGRPVVVFHSSSRHHINDVHRSGHSCIQRHTLPHGDEMKELMKDAGLKPVEVIDADNWYYAEGR